MAVEQEKMSSQLEAFKVGHDEMEAKKSDLDRQKEALLKDVDEAFKGCCSCSCSSSSSS